MLALVAAPFPIGCTQLFNWMHSVAQLGACDFLNSCVNLVFFCELFGGFREMLYICNVFLWSTDILIAHLRLELVPRKVKSNIYN